MTKELWDLGGCQMVSVHVFYSDGSSSNPAVYSFYCVKLFEMN